MRSTELRAAAARIGAIRAFGLLAFLVLAARAAHLTVIDEQGGELWRRQVYARIELPPERGVIFDRRGTELAVTTSSPSVYAMASHFDPAGVQRLAAALGMERATIAERLRDRRGFTYLARWVSDEAAGRVRALDLSGVGIVEEPRRRYPAGALAGRSLGFADIDGKGVRGIEQQEDEWLSGTRIVVPVERDGSGRLLARASLRTSDAAGGDIALTLDASLQAEAGAALQRAIRQTGARGGSIITIDPASGDVLALAEWPPFDPNQFRTTPYSATGATTFLDAAEPGSTLKVFLVAAALEVGAVGEDEWLDTASGEVEVPGKTIRDRRKFGPLRLADMLRVSSNVGAVLTAQRLGPEEHHAALSRFGFGARTGSHFPSESAGLMRPWRDWQPLDHATIAYGQGISATPIQIAAATAALANDGLWRTPRLVLARRPRDGDWEYTEAGPTHQAVSPHTAQRVLAMMREVVGPEGTGRLAGLSDLAVSGKTGTAQKLDLSTHRYATDRYVAWFIGAVPAEDPQLVITVALDEPQEIHGGGAVAAPLFAEVAAAQLAHLGLITDPEPIAQTEPPTLSPEPTPPAAKETPAKALAARERAPELRTAVAVAAGFEVSPDAPVPDAASISTAPVAVAIAVAPRDTRVMVPDFRGHSIAEVRRITEIHTIELDASGRGRAVAQEPSPGTILGAGERRVSVRFASATAPSGGR